MEARDQGLGWLIFYTLFNGRNRPLREKGTIMINKIIKYAAIGCAAYGVVKAAEFVGICKGMIYGCRLAENAPEDAHNVAREWDEFDKQWKEFKKSVKA